MVAIPLLRDIVPVITLVACSASLCVECASTYQLCVCLVYILFHVNSIFKFVILVNSLYGHLCCASQDPDVIELIVYAHNPTTLDSPMEIPEDNIVPYIEDCFHVTIIKCLIVNTWLYSD